MVDIEQLPQQYCIRLTCLHTRKFNQIVYQFAHELCHVFISPLLLHPLAEILAVTTSLVILQEMSDLWRNSSRPERRDYAEKFARYRHTVLASAVEQLELPEELQLRAWFGLEILGENGLALHDRPRQIGK